MLLQKNYCWFKVFICYGCDTFKLHVMRNLFWGSKNYLFSCNRIKRDIRLYVGCKNYFLKEIINLVL